MSISGQARVQVLLCIAALHLLGTPPLPPSLSSSLPSSLPLFLPPFLPPSLPGAGPAHPPRHPRHPHSVLAGHRHPCVRYVLPLPPSLPPSFCGFLHSVGAHLPSPSPSSLAPSHPPSRPTRLPSGHREWMEGALRCHCSSDLCPALALTPPSLPPSFPPSLPPSLPPDLLAYPLATENGWRALFAVTALLTCVQLLCSPFLLESPRWLLARNEKSREARVIMKKLRGFRDAKEVHALPPSLLRFLPSE